MIHFDLFDQLHFPTFLHMIAQEGSTIPSCPSVICYSIMNGINMLQVCLLSIKIKLLLICFNNSCSTGCFVREA